MGKSTLFRAIAGIWPFGEGAVSRPTGSAMFLPQRPYFPLGTLRRTITYPGNDADIPEAAIISALDEVGLQALIPRMNDVENWGLILSGGEQQRLAITRALITRPDWLFLDEATSALDAPMAARMQQVLARQLPGTTMVSITHRDLTDSAERHLALADGALAEV